MNSMTMKAAALALLGGSLQAAAQLTSCGESSNADFQYEVTPTEGFSMFWSIDAEAATVSFQVVTVASAWAAIGFPESDLDMIGADAIIGLPGNDSVMEYDLTDKDVAAVIPFDTQDITATSVTQDDTGTTISFTRPLEPGGDKQSISAIPGDTTAFIYAVGLDNELEYHGADGSAGFRLDVFCGSGADDIVPRTPAPVVGGDITSAPTAAEEVSTAPTPAPLEVATTTAPTPAPVGTDRGGIAAPSEGPTAAPAAVGTPSAPTASPTTAEEAEDADGQGDSDGAFRVGAGGWAAAAVATGVAGVLAAMSL